MQTHFLYFYSKSLKTLTVKIKKVSFRKVNVFNKNVSVITGFDRVHQILTQNLIQSFNFSTSYVKVVLFIDTNISTPVYYLFSHSY